MNVARSVWYDLERAAVAFEGCGRKRLRAGCEDGGGIRLEKRDRTFVSHTNFTKKEGRSELSMWYIHQVDGAWKVEEGYGVGRRGDEEDGWSEEGQRREVSTRRRATYTCCATPVLQTELLRC